MKDVATWVAGVSMVLNVVIIYLALRSIVERNRLYEQNQVLRTALKGIQDGCERYMQEAKRLEINPATEHLVRTDANAVIRTIYVMAGRISDTPEK